MVTSVAQAPVAVDRRAASAVVIAKSLIFLLLFWK
jgi:hypothetical protein